MSGNTQLYPLARQLFATAGLDWATSNIKIALLAQSYVFDITAQYITDIPSGMILATSGNITNLTAAAGYCSGDTTTMGVIASPQPAAYIVFYKDTGTPSTSPLIAFFDSTDLPGLPAVLNGLEYFIYQNTSFGGWFRL